MRDFAGNWTGGGSIAGSGDDEALTLPIGSAEESETWNLGIGTAEIKINLYKAGSGGTPTVYYKTGADATACESDSWHLYNGSSFVSLGWIKVRLEA